MECEADPERCTNRSQVVRQERSAIASTAALGAIGLSFLTTGAALLGKQRRLQHAQLSMHRKRAQLTVRFSF